MSEEVKPVEAATVVGNFQLSAQLTDGRTMAVSAYLLASDTTEDINHRIEIYHAVMEAHRLRCEILLWEKNLEAAEKQIRDATEVLKDLTAKKRSGTKLTSTDQQTLTNMPLSIAKLHENLPKMSQNIVETKQKILKLVGQRI